MIRLCVAGATGRMGSTLMREAAARGFRVVGAVASHARSGIKENQSDSAIIGPEVKIVDPTHLREAAENADVYVTFTTAAAELANLPVIAEMRKRIVMGTTGFTDRQIATLRETIGSKVSAVFSPNYAPCINVLFRLIKTLATLPSDYDFSVTEAHHIGKRDAPSGTAQKICELISQARDYKTIVHGRQGVSPREPGELEVFSVRAGGIPGTHELVVAGEHEMIRIEHVAFSRSVFAQGALRAAEWIYGQNTPGIYTMDDVLTE